MADRIPLLGVGAVVKLAISLYWPRDGSALNTDATNRLTLRNSSGSGATEATPRLVGVRAIFVLLVLTLRLHSNGGDVTADYHIYVPFAG